MPVYRLKNQMRWVAPSFFAEETFAAYHGTGKTFDSFNLPNSVAQKNFLPFGIHFAADESTAKVYQKNNVPILRANLTINRPLDCRKVVTKADSEFKIVDFVMQNQRRGLLALKRLFKMAEINNGFHVQSFLGEADTDVAESALKAFGYDGVIYDLAHVRSWGDKSKSAVSYVVLATSQIERV